MDESSCSYYKRDANGNYECINACDADLYYDGKFCRSNCTVSPNVYINGQNCTSYCPKPYAIPLDGNLCDDSCTYYTAEVEEIS